MVYEFYPNKVVKKRKETSYEGTGREPTIFSLFLEIGCGGAVEGKTSKSFVKTQVLKSTLKSCDCAGRGGRVRAYIVSGRLRQEQREQGKAGRRDPERPRVLHRGMKRCCASVLAE